MLYKQPYTEDIQTSQNQEFLFSISKNPFEGDTKSEKSIKEKKSANYNYWSFKEQTIYLNFLVEHMPMITSSQYRKKQRIFKKISTILGTRTPVQVKSHHQKLEDKFRTIPKIIDHLQMSIFGEQKSTEAFVSDSRTQILTNDVLIQTQNMEEIIAFMPPLFNENYLDTFLKFNYEEEDFSLLFQ